MIELKDGKNIFASKTIWAAGLIAVIGVLNALGYGQYSELLLTLGGALGLYGIRDAVSKNK